MEEEENITGAYNHSGPSDVFPVDELIIYTLTALSCLGGLMGNAKIIWLLRCQRTYFTTYILNLAAADCGTLLSLSLRVIILFISPLHQLSEFGQFIFHTLISFTYSARLYLLTAISMDRYLSVRFPIWYQGHQPGRSSALISTLAWIISGLVSELLILYHVKSIQNDLTGIRTISIIDLVIFTPVILCSTLTLFIKIYCNSQRVQPLRMYTAVFSLLVFFVIFAIPLRVSHLIVLKMSSSSLALELTFLFLSVDCSINPIIYFWVGRNRKHNPKESLKAGLQSLFNDETDLRGRINS